MASAFSCVRYSKAVCLRGTPFMTNFLTLSNEWDAVTNECAIVPEIGIPNLYPARTLDVPWNPPRNEYLLAIRPPSGPCARRRPNSRTRTFSPASLCILAAFVVTKVAKFTMFNKGVSRSCRNPIGPYKRINGSLGKTSDPSSIAMLVKVKERMRFSSGNE